MSFAKRHLEEIEERYYRKYICPECNVYHLHIANENFAECPEGYQTSDTTIISNIIDSEDFQGRFTGDELQNKFY